MRYRFLVIALVAAGLAAQPAVAVPVPMADVPAMAAASDLIVAGRATQTQNTLAPFLVTVDRVLKGAQTFHLGSWSNPSCHPKTTLRSRNGNTVSSFYNGSRAAPTL
jgi:hypothetical protein